MIGNIVYFALKKNIEIYFIAYMSCEYTVCMQVKLVRYISNIIYTNANQKFKLINYLDAQYKKKLFMSLMLTKTEFIWSQIQ